MSGGSGVEELAAGVHRLPTDYPAVADAPLGVYLFEGSVNVMSDAACASSWDAALRPALRQLGLSAQDVHWVLVSHGHPDHMGAIGALRAAGSPCRVAASLDDAPWVESFDRQWREFWDGLPGVVDASHVLHEQREMSGGGHRVDRLLRDGEVLRLGEREFEVLMTRAHTRGHTAFLERTSGVLLTGDLGLGRIVTSSSGTNAFGPLYYDVDEHVAAIERLRALPFTWLCPSHQVHVRREDADVLFDEALQLVEENEQIVMDLLAPGNPVRVQDVARRLGEHWGMSPAVWLHSGWVAAAHLERAARRGLVEPGWTRRKA